MWSGKITYNIYEPEFNSAYYILPKQKYELKIYFFYSIEQECRGDKTGTKVGIIVVNYLSTNRRYI